MVLIDRYSLRLFHSRSLEANAMAIFNLPTAYTFTSPTIGPTAALQQRNLLQKDLQSTRSILLDGLNACPGVQRYRERLATLQTTLVHDI